MILMVWQTHMPKLFLTLGNIKTNFVSLLFKNTFTSVFLLSVDIKAPSLESFKSFLKSTKRACASRRHLLESIITNATRLRKLSVHFAGRSSCYSFFRFTYHAKIHPKFIPLGRKTSHSHRPPVSLFSFMCRLVLNQHQLSQSYPMIRSNSP